MIMKNFSAFFFKKKTNVNFGAAAAGIEIHGITGISSCWDDGDGWSFSIPIFQAGENGKKKN